MRKNNYIKKFVTVFYIDIRNYTKLSEIKELSIVGEFIMKYRQYIKSSSQYFLKNNKLLSNINVGDAVLYIIESSENKEKDLVDVIEFSQNVRTNLLKLLSEWKSRKDNNGNTMNYFENVNFGIGISQGIVLVKDEDFIGFAINQAAKIGDMRNLHKRGHIGIDIKLFSNDNIVSKIRSDKTLKDKLIGHPKVGEFIYYEPYKKQFGVIYDN